MLVEGPKNSYQQLAKVEAGGDISEYEDLMSGISGGMSNLTLDESWRSLDDARFGSHFVNSYVKDDDSMPSVVNDDGQGGATTAQQLGGQSGNLLICPPGETGFHGGFLPYMTCISVSALLYWRQAE
eukprot:evm.model.scf_2696.2 EVM.evm.TU.scf_2696.2   scf_2696:18208-18588(-)